MTSKKFSVLALFAGLVFVLSSSIHDAHATTFTATQNGDWVDTATWGGSAPPITINSGDTVSVPAGVAVTITSRLTISNSGTINNSGTITNIEGTIISDGTINNSGTINNNFFGNPIHNAGETITNSGTINNSGGTINNNRNGIMTNTGSITNSGGTINNNIGNIINSGTISNISGTVNNFGYLSNIGTITNSDIINNAGTILSPCNYIGNGGIITNNSGATINNTGTIASYVSINNSGTINNNVGGIITNHSGGAITNSGTINNAGGTINNTISGTITNSGAITITNSGTINNLGNIINSATISNNSGKINNSGYFSNTGTVTNSDTINNTGYIGNGNILNNNSSATINNAGTISSYGTITNSGTIINYSGGTINKVSGGSTILNSGIISDNPSPFNFTVAITDSNQCGDTPPSHPGDDPPPSRIKPSFGGVGNMVFADGLTLDGKVYNLGNFGVNIPKNIANVGQPITIKIKEQLGFGPQDWKYIAVYMNFEGKSPETYNAHLILSNDKNDGPKLVDPKGYVNDFKVTTVLDSQYVYTTFSFTAAKAMPDTSMIVTAWDGHNRVNNVYVGGAIQFGNDPIVQPYHAPDWLHEYTNFQDASLAVENQGYQKPLIFGHISNSEQVWKGSDGGSLKWLFDDANKTVSLVIYDNNGITVFKKTESLKKVDSIYSKCTDRKDCMYSWSAHGQLSRTDSGKLEKAKKDEQDRALATLHNIGYAKHYP